MRKIPTSVWIMLTLVVSALAIIGFVLWANNRTLANVTLPLEITEFFDYRCTHCADFHSVIEEVKSEYGDKVKVTYRYYPFLSDDSYTVAYGAFAAGKQGKFTEYHNAAFEGFVDVRDNNGDQAQITPEALATKIGLDMEQFNTDRNSQEAKDVIAADKAAGAQAGVSGTPFVLVFGKVVETGATDPATGGITYQPFKDTVARLISVAEQNKK